MENQNLDQNTENTSQTEGQENEQETEHQEIQPFVNDSRNPLTKMFCTTDYRYLNRHAVNLERMFYDFLGEHEKIPLWSVKSAVILANAAVANSMFPIYNEYIKQCKRLAEAHKDHEVMCVVLTFDIDN